MVPLWWLSLKGLLTPTTQTNVYLYHYLSVDSNKCCSPRLNDQLSWFFLLLYTQSNYCKFRIPLLIITPIYEGEKEEFYSKDNFNTTEKQNLKSKNVRINYK